MPAGCWPTAARCPRALTLTSKSVLGDSLRRLKPERHRKRLTQRDRRDLPFLAQVAPAYPKLLLDTTVYIDALQGRLEEQAEIALRAGSLWHCTVTEAELAALSGLLDPLVPGTQEAVKQVAASIEQRPAHRILNPDRDVWREAGVLAGLLARLQGYGRRERRKALNDALIFLTAAKNGCAVLTRNLADFDLLMQLDSRGRAIFYQRT
jgi:predicted nucleic acid-binding protein